MKVTKKKTDGISETQESIVMKRIGHKQAASSQAYLNGEGASGGGHVGDKRHRANWAYPSSQLLSTHHLITHTH